MMDIKDANKVIQNLQTKPYICSENTMELDNGYVIAKKEYFKELKKKADQLTDCEDPGEQGETLRRNAKFIYAKDVFPEEYEKMFEAIEVALGFELFIWQKSFIAHGEFRQTGETTARVLRDLMMVNEPPLDLSRYSGNHKFEHYRQSVRGIKQQLDEAGVPTREVFFDRKQKEAYIRRKANQRREQEGQSAEARPPYNFRKGFEI